MARVNLDTVPATYVIVRGVYVFPYSSVDQRRKTYKSTIQLSDERNKRRRLDQKLEVRVKDYKTRVCPTTDVYGQAQTIYTSIWCPSSRISFSGFCYHNSCHLLSHPLVILKVISANSVDPDLSACMQKTGLKSLQKYSADDINRRHFQMQVFLSF